MRHCLLASFFFFFSSRRRHTRFSRDWSSDVCSSDLGPATVATLTKFALRCGIGNSMRSLRGQIGRYGRLLTDAGPDDVMRGLQSAPAAATASISGLHLFPFGGLRKAGNWLRTYPDEMMQQTAPASCRSEEHTSELQSRENLVCRLLLEKKKKK